MNKRTLALLVLLVVIVLAFLGRNWVYVMFSSYEGVVASTSALEAKGPNHPPTLLIMSQDANRVVPADRATVERVKPGDRVRKGLFQLRPRVIEKAKPERE